MPYPGLLHPEPPPLRQATVDRTSAGDTQTQFWLNLCGVSGSWCTQGLFEPSELLLREWGFILNLNSPPILLGLLLCPWMWVIYSKLFQLCEPTALASTILLGLLLCLWMWGISSQPLQLHIATAPVPIIW